MESVEHTFKLSWSARLAHNKFRRVKKKKLSIYTKLTEQIILLLSTQTTEVPL